MGNRIRQYFLFVCCPKPPELHTVLHQSCRYGMSENINVSLIKACASIFISLCFLSRTESHVHCFSIMSVSVIDRNTYLTKLINKKEKQTHTIVWE